MFLFLAFSGIGFSIYILWLPIITIIQFILTLGIIFITSAINVYIRDAEYIINFIISMLFYATPILYNSEMFIGTSVEWIIHLNPMATLINSYRDVLFYQTMPNINSLIIVFMMSVLLCIVGYKIFKKLEKGFAEEV